MSVSANYQSALSALSAANPVADIDNVFLCAEGWVYRHFTSADGSTFWDEILVAIGVDSAEYPVGNAFGAPSVKFASNDGTGDDADGAVGDYDLSGTTAVETDLI